ncbi:hypothetical protein ACKWTF_011043 [Chironomus riparius]
MDDFPFKVEYAKSGRASCRGCKSSIGKDDLRLARMVQSYHHDGKDPHWFHMNCFFAKHRPKSIEEVEHFENIRYEDQKTIRGKIEELSGILLPEPKRKGKKRTADEASSSSAAAKSLIVKDFGVEYSKSSRATCVGCGSLIMKEQIRIKKMDYDTEVGQKFGGQPLWHHLECFDKIKTDYNFYLGGSDLPGFRDLSPADQKEVKNVLKAIEITEAQAKKLKSEPKDKNELKEENALETKIAKQTKQLFKVRDTIKPIAGNGDLQNILFANNSGMVEGVDGLLDRVTDFLTFGALEKCQKCKKGDLVFAKHGYKCNGTIDEWTPCDNFQEKPNRVKCVIPSELKNSKTATFFTKYKAKVEDRAVRKNLLADVKKAKEEETTREYKVKREKEPLYGFHIVILGDTKKPKDELKKIITKLGGKVVTKLQERIAVVISNPEEVEKMNSRMREVKSYDIQVVPETFLKAVEKGTRNESMEKIKSMSICEWGSDPLTRIPLEDEGPKEKESMYARNTKKTASVKLKNGTALDPESGLDDVAHVYRDNITNQLYTSVLGLTDITKNKNSFYKMQVLESDAGKNYWLFRSWGRIGTSVGSTKTDSFFSAQEACEEFERLFEDKTGNYWGTDFQKQPGKYSPIEVDYDDEEKAKQLAEKQKIKSKLPAPVQDLVKMIFDIDTMKKTMLEFELDLEKMPLGRLSKKQLQTAYETLNELDKLVAKGAKENEFIGLSNKFFTLVPHNFGMKAAPIISTLEIIQSKREMIDSLLEIEIAYSILQEDDKENEDVNPVDAHYKKLKTDMKPLDKKGKEFELIKRYVENTHAKTHDKYKLEILEVFKVDRSGERRRYKPFKKLHNRQLLWHGSRLTNYAGILSHGLKIAPPEAPCKYQMMILI